MNRRRHFCSPRIWVWLALGVSLASGANASLISMDLNSPGDRLLTFDATTGLSWLNVPLTYGKTYDQVVAGYGGYIGPGGFQFATASQFSRLLIDANITEGGSTTNDTTNINNTRALENLLGVTYNDGHTFYTIGYLAGTTPSVPVNGVLAVNDIGEYDAGSGVGNQIFLDVVGSGSLLVSGPEIPTPEPVSLGLLATGLVGLGLARWRRARSPLAE